MEYLYTALLLDSAGQKVNEDNVKKVMTAAGAKPDESKIKALVTALEGVDIKEAVSKAAPVMGGVAEGQKEAKAEKKEEKKEAVSDSEAAAGLGSLFG